MKKETKGIIAFAAACMIVIFTVVNGYFYTEAEDLTQQDSTSITTTTDTVEIEDEETALAASAPSRAGNTAKTTATICVTILGMAAVVIFIRKVTDTDKIPS